MPSAKRTSWEAVFTFSMTGGIKMKPPGGAEEFTVAFPG